MRQSPTGTRTPARPVIPTMLPQSSYITVPHVIRLKCSKELEGLYSKPILLLLTIQLIVSSQRPSLGWYFNNADNKISNQVNNGLKHTVPTTLYDGSLFYLRTIVYRHIKVAHSPDHPLMRRKLQRQWSPLPLKITAIYLVSFHLVP